MLTYTLLRSMRGLLTAVAAAGTKSKTKVNVNTEVFLRKTNSDYFYLEVIFINGDFHLDFKIVKRSEGMTSVDESCLPCPVHRITDDRIGETYRFQPQNRSSWSYYISACFRTFLILVESSSALWNEVERSGTPEQWSNSSVILMFAILVELNRQMTRKN